jgi:hypothetical protein
LQILFLVRQVGWIGQAGRFISVSGDKMQQNVFLHKEKQQIRLFFSIIIAIFDCFCILFLFFVDFMPVFVVF